MVVELDIGIHRCRPVGHDDIEPVQRQIAQQIIQLTFVAHHAQMRLGDHRQQQPVYHQLGQSVTDAHRQPHCGSTDRIAHPGRQVLAEQKDQVRLLHGCQSGLGQHQPAPRWFEQGIPQRSLQFAYLRTDRLHRHVQFVGCAGYSTFLRNHPKVVEMFVIERDAHVQFFRDC